MQGRRQREGVPGLPRVRCRGVDGRPQTRQAPSGGVASLSYSGLTTSWLGWWQSGLQKMRDHMCARGDDSLGLEGGRKCEDGEDLEVQLPQLIAWRASGCTLLTLLQISRWPWLEEGW